MLHATLLLAALTVSVGPAPGDLIGQVVDASQKPIPKATVFIYTAKPRIGQGILCPGCYADCGKKAVTDADGKFLVSALAPDLLFRVLVVAEGFRPQFANNVDPLKEPLNMKLETMPSDFSHRAALRGRVFDMTGKPVVGAVVSPTGCERADRRWGGQMPGVDPASVTNLRGEFLITGNQGDLGYDLEVEARGFAKCLVGLLPTGEKMHEIRIAEGATVQGRILKDGKPMPGIAVGLVQCNTAGSGRFVGCYHIATNDDGRYTFVNVHPNDDYFVFTAMSDVARLGGMMIPKRISVDADGTTNRVGDCTLTSAVHRVSGHVILTDGKPVPAGTQLLLSREELGTWDGQTTVIAADGSFSFAGVPEEAVTLNARIPSYRLASRRNRFQQVQSWAVAMFVDADKVGLELFFEPETANPSAKTSMRPTAKNLSELLPPPQERTATENSPDAAARTPSPWNRKLSNGRLLTGKSHPEVYAVAFSPDSKQLAVATTYAKENADNYTSLFCISLWDVAAAKRTALLEPSKPMGLVYSLAYSPDGRTLVSGDGYSSDGGKIRAWDVSAGKEIRVWEGHKGGVYSVAFSPDGKTIVSGGHDKTVRLWDAATGREIKTISGHEDYIPSVAVSPDGATLATGGGDRKIMLWNINTGANVAVFEGHKKSIYSLAFSPDGRLLASGANWDTRPRLWNVKTGRNVAVLEGCTDAVQSVAFSPDGGALAAGTLNYGLHVWEVATGRHLASVEGGDCVAFSPDGRRLAAGFMNGEGDGGVQLWDVTPSEPSGKQ